MKRCPLAPAAKGGHDATVVWSPVGPGKAGDESASVRLFVRSAEGPDGAVTVVRKRFAATVALEVAGPAPAAASTTVTASAAVAGAGDMMVGPSCRLLGRRAPVAPITRLPYSYLPVGYGSVLPLSSPAVLSGADPRAKQVGQTGVDDESARRRGHKHRSSTVGDAAVDASHGDSGAASARERSRKSGKRSRREADVDAGATGGGEES
jgi:hypothetical protein